MGTRSLIRQGMTLDEFLQWTRIDEKPYLEYLDGRIEVKVSPRAKHSVIELKIANAINAFAEPRGLGLAFPDLRCTFAGRSIVPDVVFLLDHNIQSDHKGEILDEMFTPPDLHIEIRSPGQGVRKTEEKLAHSVANGCPLGWYIDPYRRTVREYRPGRSISELSESDVLDGAPALPGLLIPVAEVLGWLVYRVQRPDNPGADPR